MPGLVWSGRASRHPSSPPRPGPTRRRPGGPGGRAVSRGLARAGVALSALAVFTCGWLAMRTDDWRRVVGFSVLALAAGALASAFSRRAR